MANPDSVRLSEEQVVEVCAGGRYRTGVCSDKWDDVDATVVCRQLDLGEVGGMSSLSSILISYVYAIIVYIQSLTPLDLDFIELSKPTRMSAVPAVKLHYRAVHMI